MPSTRTGDDEHGDADHPTAVRREQCADTTPGERLVRIADEWGTAAGMPAAVRDGGVAHRRKLGRVGTTVHAGSPDGPISAISR